MNKTQSLHELNLEIDQKFENFLKGVFPHSKYNIIYPHFKVGGVLDRFVCRLEVGYVS